ncbi:hypothetical protein ASG43_05160 [Aureimonas sp. Leaf454]|uniref:GNAT family N-acetyltransferase n=1 Tax=Aureimonas sp. Leaf454 TaxID=1736381 RepID=UPI00070079D6|nr:GNAT family N-acetyltransferase [Aureimonas sp. Leaf454]KQT50677.1 hypothetical protein ASG43_05160 [Aureimonas sp. Leaf454]
MDLQRDETRAIGRLPMRALQVPSSRSAGDASRSTDEGLRMETPAIRVRVVGPDEFAGHDREWRDLAERAAVANVFMDPAVATAVASSSREPLRILLAWHEADADHAAPFLVGVWLAALRPTRATWPLRGFVSPITPMAYLGTPVVDADHAELVFLKFLEALRWDRGLPRWIEIGDFSAGLLPDLRAAVARLGMHEDVIGARRRAELLPCDDPVRFWSATRSKAHIKQSERQRRKLGELGRVERTITGDAERIAAEIDEFLALESAGWKGARGSALASRTETARIVRWMVSGLAARGQVKIHALRLDGRPVAMSLLLTAGREAFTWRIAYDEAFRRFSPGILLLEDVTLDLLGDPTVRRTDSCNHRDTGFQAERWTDRHDLIDVLLDVRSRSPGLLRLLATRERALRRLLDRLRDARRLVKAHIAARRKGAGR